jgi:membrane-bound lytic murein transglycosylase A
VPLTAGASLAVDNRIHPLGVPLFVATALPDGKPLRRLLVAQDTGGAIRGAVRGDVYWGVGQRAERLAGAMKSKGEMYILLPNKIAARLAPTKTFAIATP